VAALATGDLQQWGQGVIAVSVEGEAPPTEQEDDAEQEVEEFDEEQLPAGFKVLKEFSDKYNLPTDALVELQHILSKTLHEAEHDAVSYQWEEIHNLIKERSVNSSLMVMNLPDPPSMPEAAKTDPEAHTQYLELITAYMEYIEGLTSSLPRVMYIHGAGREVIRFAE